MNAICGSLLDKYEGVRGYRYIFIMMLAIALVGLVSSWILYFMSKRKKQEA